MQRAGKIIARKGKPAPKPPKATDQAAKAAPKQPADYTPEQLQEFGRLLVEYKASMPPKPGDSPKRRERPEEIRVTGEGLRQLRIAIADVHFAAVSIAKLAWEVGGMSGVSGRIEWFALAIENVAKACAMKADSLHGLIGRPDDAIGHFRDEFTPSGMGKERNDD